MSNHIKRISIWTGWYRVSHLLIGLSTLLLLASGSLIQYSPALAELALDIHHYCAGFFLAGLFIRLSLMLFGKPHERLSYLFPKTSEWRNILRVLGCYLSFGKLKLPNWYAQNPLWKPIYLLIYLVLCSQLLSGYLLIEGGFLSASTASFLHLYGSTVLLTFCLLHIIASIFHDYQASTSDVSAMINGIRTFTIDTPAANKTAQAVKFSPMKKPKSSPAAKND